MVADRKMFRLRKVSRTASSLIILSSKGTGCQFIKSLYFHRIINWLSEDFSLLKPFKNEDKCHLKQTRRGEGENTDVYWPFFFLVKERHLGRITDLSQYAKKKTLLYMATHAPI